MVLKERVAHDQTLDNTLALSQEGYMFIKNRMDKYKTSVFETRLLGQKAICISGEEAARVFYDPERFQRNGALPKAIQKTLFGVDAIQTMDGEEHLHRKQMFMSMMTPLHEKQLANLITQNWGAYIEKWEKAESIILLEEAKEILCLTACKWAGIPLTENEVKERAEDFYAMVDAFGAVGLRHWKGRMARKRTEEWLCCIVKDVRSGNLKAKDGSMLNTVVSFKNLKGQPLSDQMTAIEIINTIRPIVAIAIFITFTAIALQEHPECKEKILSDLSEDRSYLEMFVQEVRRYYPLTPFIGARVRKNFSWKQCDFKEGNLVLLDVYGMNHDVDIWDNPFAFRPERFNERKSSLFDFIPQGGGDPSKGHRCPGEGITIEIMKASLDFLVNKIDFQVPDQDLSFSTVRMPALPESGFIMNNIKGK
ncbi:MAG: cytochrome P450 [Clostridiaceae bacterium]